MMTITAIAYLMSRVMPLEFGIDRRHFFLVH